MDHTKMVHHFHGRRRHKIKSTVLPALLLFCIGFADRCQSVAIPDSKPNPDPAKSGPSVKAPLIFENPADIIAIRSKGGRFYCRARGDPDPQIKWLKDGRPLRSAMNRFTMPTGEIVFHRISSDDEGIYQCLAWNSAGEVKSRNASLRIAFIKEDFRIIPKDTVAEVSGKATIECSGPRGLPEPNITWRKDDRPLDPTDARLQVVGGDLIISDARKSDSGTYQCVATNVADTRTSLPVLLAIQERPYFVIKPEDKSVIEGRQVELTCEAQGDPKPRIRWTRTDLRALSPRVVPMSNGNLLITNVRRSDEGGYTCNAENRVTLITATVYIEVKTPPVFVRFPENVNANVGDTVVLPCSAKGRPMPTLLWHKIDGPNMFPGISYQDGHKIVSKNGDLTISNVRFSDEGHYTCQAIGAGEPITASATLIVLSKSNIYPPIIRQGPINRTVTQGHAVELRCTTVAVPTANIEWTKDGFPVLPSWDRFEITASRSLKIMKVQITDAGQYTCTATNDFGQSYRHAWIKVSDKAVSTQDIKDLTRIPGPPSAPTLLNATSSSLTLRWKPNSYTGSSPLIGYKMEYYCLQSESASWVTVARDILQNTFTVRGLDASSSYVFIVRAVNEYGLGDPSDVSDVINTLDKEGSNILERLNEVSVRISEATPIPPSSQSRGISLVWESSATCNDIDGYIIYFQPVSVQNGAILKEIAPCYAQSHDLHGLKKRTTFEIRMRPYKGKHEGRPSPILLVSTESEGTSPRAPALKIESVTYNSNKWASATFSWSSPIQILPQYVKRYTLRCHEKIPTADAYDQTVCFNSSVNAVTIHNLPRGRDYVALLLFSTELGIGVYSQKQEFSVEAAVQDDAGLPPIMKNPGILAAIAASVLLSIGIVIGLLLYQRYRRDRKNRGLPGIDRAGISLDTVRKQPQYIKGFTMSIMDGNGVNPDQLYRERSNDNAMCIQRQSIQQREMVASQPVTRNTTSSLNSAGNIGTSMSHDLSDIRTTSGHRSSFSYVADQLTSLSSIPPQFSSPDTARTPMQVMKTIGLAHPWQSYYNEEGLEETITNLQTGMHAANYHEQNTGREVNNRRDLINMQAPPDETMKRNMLDMQLPPPPPSPPLSQKSSSRGSSGTGSSTNQSSGRKRCSEEMGSEWNDQPVLQSFPTDIGGKLDDLLHTLHPRDFHNRAVRIQRMHGYTSSNKIAMLPCHSNVQRGDEIAVELNTRAVHPSYLTGPCECETESELAAPSMKNTFKSHSDSSGLRTPPSSLESLNMESASQVGIDKHLRMMSDTQAYNSSEAYERSGFAKTKPTRLQQRSIVDERYLRLKDYPSPSVHICEPPTTTHLFNRINSIGSSSSSSYHQNTADSGLGAGVGSCGHNSLNSSSSADSCSKGQISRSRTTGSLYSGNLECTQSDSSKNTQRYFSSTERCCMPASEYQNKKRGMQPTKLRKPTPMGKTSAFDSRQPNFQDADMSMTSHDNFSTENKRTTLLFKEFATNDGGAEEGDPSNKDHDALLADKAIFCAPIGRAAHERLHELTDVPEASTSDFCEDYSDRSQ